MITKRIKYCFDNETKSVLNALEKITYQKSFAPNEAHIHYRITANGFQSAICIPLFYSQILEQVASLRLEVSPSHTPTAESLRSDNFDILFSPVAPDHNDIMAVRIFNDDIQIFYDGNIRSAPETIKDLCIQNLCALISHQKKK